MLGLPVTPTEELARRESQVLETELRTLETQLRGRLQRSP
jgi:hypothetical protein